MCTNNTHSHLYLQLSEAFKQRRLKDVFQNSVLSLLSDHDRWFKEHLHVPPSVCQSFSLISYACQPRHLKSSTSNVLIKSQAQMLITSKKSNLPSPPTEPQSRSEMCWYLRPWLIHVKQLLLRLLDSQTRGLSKLSTIILNLTQC